NRERVAAALGEVEMTHAAVFARGDQLIGRTPVSALYCARMGGQPHVSVVAQIDHGERNAAIHRQMPALGALLETGDRVVADAELESVIGIHAHDLHTAAGPTDGERTAVGEELDTSRRRGAMPVPEHLTARYFNDTNAIRCCRREQRPVATESDRMDRRLMRDEIALWPAGEEGAQRALKAWRREVPLASLQREHEPDMQPLGRQIEYACGELRRLAFELARKLSSARDDVFA